MSYEQPTASQLKAKYPAFADVADATVDIYIGEAATTAVDTSWREADYAPAVMAFAGHSMAALGIGDHGKVAGYAREGVTNLRSGSFAVSLDADRAKSAAAGELDATPYGQQYKRLLGMNKGGPRVMPATIRPGGTWPFFRQNDGRVVP